jgi:hypothetical protein
MGHTPPEVTCRQVVFNNSVIWRSGNLASSKISRFFSWKKSLHNLRISNCAFKSCSTSFSHLCCQTGHTGTLSEHILLHSEIFQEMSTGLSPVSICFIIAALPNYFIILASHFWLTHLILNLPQSVHLTGMSLCTLCILRNLTTAIFIFIITHLLPLCR